MTEDRAALIRKVWTDKRSSYTGQCADRGYVVLAALAIPPLVVCADVNQPISLGAVERLVFRFEVRDDRQHWRITCEGLVVEDGFMRAIGQP